MKNAMKAKPTKPAKPKQPKVKQSEVFRKLPRFPPDFAEAVEAGNL